MDYCYSKAAEAAHTVCHLEFGLRLFLCRSCWRLLIAF